MGFYHESFNRSQLKDCDILFSIAGAFGRAAVIENKILPANTNQALAIISPKLSSVHPRYLFYILKSANILREVKNQIVGVAQYNLSLTQVANLKIPLPPLEIQREIIAELDSYQNIIAGAKQIITNWKPMIDIDPGWEKLTIGELIKNKTIEKPLDGNHGELHPKASDYVKAGIPFIMANDLVDGEVDIEHSKKITSEQAKSLRKGFAKNEDVLLTHKGTIGRTAILHTSYDYVVLTPQVTYYRVKNHTLLSNKFLKYYFDSETFQNRLKQLASIGATRAYLGITDQLGLEVALPSLEIQKQIVAQIEEEQKLVEANKKLIEIFEQKIKDKIAEVWGEELNNEPGQNASSNGTQRQAQRVQQAAAQAELKLG